MNFVNTTYLSHILVGCFLLLILFFYLNKKYFDWIKTYWFYQRTWTSRFSTFLYSISFILMFVSLLDLRGPEEKIKSNLPDQRTIIILDSSASMLAEDVRPSRFSKAIQMARHFVKSAAGHQISLVLFSDIQKRLIPFTDDIDLIDSRLAALEKTNAVSGGSNISQAIAEAISYFENEDGGQSATGNVLVFTDAEESEGAFDLDLGSNINLAIVGIGTAKGANIPLRWDDGSFRGYKTSKGEVVSTKLDEDYIKKIGRNVKSYKYWIANSYSLPTQEILSFYRGVYTKSQGKGDVRIRPVLSQRILIPAIILYCLSVIVGRFASLKVLTQVVVFILALGSSYTSAQESKKNEKPIPESLKSDLEAMKQGKADRTKVLKIAEGFLRNDDPERANEIYSEYGKVGDDTEVVFNRATALLKSNKVDEALPLVQQILDGKNPEEIKNKMRNNLILALNNGSGGKGQNKKNDKNESESSSKDSKDQDNKDEKKNQDQDKKKDGKNGKGEEEDKKDNKDNKSGQSKDQSKKNEDQGKDKDEDKKQKDPKDLDKPQRQDSRPQSLEEKERMIEQKRKMVKTPAMVKQILSDDRELQKKMMDTSTNERGSSKPKRDW